MTSNLLQESLGGSLEAWRRRILRAVLLVLVSLGLLAYVPSLLLSLQVGAIGVAVADTVVYAWAIGLLFIRGLTVRTRSIQLVALFYLLAVFLLAALGPQGAGPYWLFAASILASVFFGTRAALASIAVNLVFVVAYGVAIAL